MSAVPKPARDATNYESLFGTPEAAANTLAISMVASSTKGAVPSMAATPFERYADLAGTLVPALSGWLLEWLVSPAGEPSRR